MKLKIKMIVFMIFVLLLYPNKAKAECVDVVLFWGQSNMVGSAGSYAIEKKADNRDISNIIDSDIISQYKSTNYVSVQIPKGVAKEYKLEVNNNGEIKEKLVDITNKTEILGDSNKLTYINGTLVPYSSKYQYYSIEPSKGTNVIPQFCKTYYEMTGRKLIVIMAAKCGEKISNFLPVTDEDYTTDEKEKKYIYEAMKTKYLNAIEYLEKNNYTIQNKFYVVLQGEADACSPNLSKEYYNTFSKVHTYLKEDLGMDFGAIIETARRINETEKLNECVIQVHDAQEALARNNNDIIIGTDLGYNLYKKGEKNAFCLEKIYNAKTKQYDDNSTHYTSATLSQLGKNTAKSVVSYLKTLETNQAPHISVSSKNNVVFYNINDGGSINKFIVRKNTYSGKVLIDRNFSNKKNINEKLEIEIPNKNKKNRFWAYSSDNEGNDIGMEFTVYKDNNGMISTNNSPNLYNVFMSGNKVYFFFEDGNGIYSFKARNLSTNIYKSKSIKNLARNTGELKRAYFTVDLKEMTYKNGYYYIYVRATDSSSDKLCTTERISLKMK